MLSNCVKNYFKSKAVTTFCFTVNLHLQWSGDISHLMKISKEILQLIT